MPARRDILQGIAALAASSLMGCDPRQWRPPAAPNGVLLVDAHCHVFNASDLPATRFLNYVVLEHYPKTAEPKLLNIQEPTLRDRVIQLFIEILGAGKAPDAEAELAYLKGVATKRVRSASVAAARASAIDGAEAFLLKVQRRLSEPTIKATPAQRSADDRILDAFREASGVEMKSLDIAGHGPPSARVMAERAAASSTDLGGYIRWFALFTMYRHALVDQLTADTTREGYTPILLCPAMVDYDRWLRESVGSSLSDQVAVMGAISKRPTGPAVHGYFGFDPLREVYFREGKDPVSPLEVARTALTEHGFLGVKLYPPMGFRASNNVGPFPERILQDIPRGLPKKLDEALEALYQLCEELDAPILAHAYGSNGANKDFALRADTAFWIPVFERHPRLRVCLAHFGRFDQHSEGGPDTLPEGSWEWTIGRYIKANRERHVLRDISYLSEVLTSKDSERARIAAAFRRYVAEFDPDVEHMAFGSDWIMLGKEPGYEEYIIKVDAFLKDDCGMSDAARAKVFSTNALKHLGLGRDDRARERILGFYAANNLDPARLPFA
ncbi:MAG: hypothetical protein DI534_11235 [Leifsonia xyli]|nr:MAG: hypothetical protein DI534_11235 [Leifsonia xyli]